MPAMDIPPQVAQPPALVAPAPACHYVNNSEAQRAFARLRERLPGTAFAGAKPSEICGLVRVQLARGSVAYTDATGRYFLLALALDTHKGTPADNDQSIESALEQRESFPVDPVPGVFPPPADSSGN